jgi:serine protease Do
MGFDHGVIVSDVKKDGPADKAGVKSDDIILGLNGKPVKDGDDLVSHIADMPVGTPCVLSVDRDGKKMDFKLAVQDRLKVFWDDPRVAGEVKSVPTSNTEEEKPEVVSKVVQFGIQVRALGDDEKNLTTDKGGMVVTRVEPNSFAADIGMIDRDIITSIDRKPINSVDDIKKIQSTLKPGDPVVFRVVRSFPGARRTAGNTPNTQVLWLPGTLPE